MFLIYVSKHLLKSRYVLFNLVTEGMTEIQSYQLPRGWQQKGQKLDPGQLPGSIPAQ